MSSPGNLPELDALRSQVADLSRQLAERDRSSQHQREQSDLLRAIVEGTAAETGDAFFSALVTHLTSVLHVKYALIGEVLGDHIKKIRTLAVSAGGVIVDNFEYALAHTPCASTLTQSFACFDRNLQTMFPQFTRLVDLGAESYCAVPLRTKGGAVMGLLVVMDTKPLQQGDDLQALLEVVAPRVAAEFERRRAEQERAQALADLHNVIETIPDIVFALDTQGNVVKWNRRLGDVTGYSSGELLNKPARLHCLPCLLRRGYFALVCFAVLMISLCFFCLNGSMSLHGMPISPSVLSHEPWSMRRYQTLCVTGVTHPASTEVSAAMNLPDWVASLSCGSHSEVMTIKFSAIGLIPS